MFYNIQIILLTPVISQGLSSIVPDDVNNRVICVLILQGSSGDVNNLLSHQIRGPPGPTVSNSYMTHLAIDDVDLLRFKVLADLRPLAEICQCIRRFSPSSPNDLKSHQQNTFLDTN